MQVVLIGTIGLVAIVVTGTVALVRPGVVPSRPRHRVTSRLAAARAELSRSIGPVATCVLLLCAAIGVLVVVGWPLGALVSRYGHFIDRPIYHWVGHHRYTGSWARAMKQLTKMGDKPRPQAFAGVAAVLLIFVARRRRWVPPVLIVAMYYAQHYLQLGLLALVHRPHPLTNDGTYPSGSALRLIALCGFSLIMALDCARQRWPAFASRRWAIAVGFVIAIAAYVEGYTRIDLMRHWLTDLFGGWILGVILLTAFVFAARTLVGERDVSEVLPPSPVRRAPSRHP